jgi:flagellar basal-body rod protein FlgB
MDFSRLPLFSMLTNRLGYLSDRQRVLAENIANVDTPEYKAKDLKKQNFDEMVRGASQFHMAVTQGNHISSGPGRGGVSSNSYTRQKPTETVLSGNAVTLDVEMMKVAQTASDNELATSLYHKQISMFRNVLGGGGG